MQINGIAYTFTGITSYTLPTVLPQFNKPIALTDVLQLAAPALVHYLRDGEVILFKRSRSRVWKCKYKLFTGAWVRVSTRKTNKDYAAQVACDLYDEARYRERMGLAPIQKTFAEIARIS